MPERRKLLIDHYKLIGQAMPIRYDDLPDPINLDPVFQWWTKENFADKDESNYHGETDPNNVQILLFQSFLNGDEYEDENQDPNKIFIPYWDKGNNRGYLNKPPSVKFLSVNEYIDLYNEQNEKKGKQIQDIYDKIDKENPKLGKEYAKIKNKYVNGTENKQLLPVIKKFIETAITNYDNIQNAKSNKDFGIYIQNLKVGKKKRNIDIEEGVKIYYDKAIELQNNFVKEGSEKIEAPPRGKEDTSFLTKSIKTRLKYEDSSESEGSGKKGMSKKAILNILKSKTPKSNSAIKQLDTEIFKILNS